ncbi:unnamed protein product [Heligmosomoides polygyrus]|uniref:Col_cuticle_N domain-containing protein n=1 Tax=Heligmosomoides polygyrus TaxID=6339 RepID=A0A183G572_HELPZ|nr:unnamed protein product [Heligmosomoides polygyrus]
MRERNAAVSRAAASAAVAPHRIPLMRTMYVVAGTVLFFFLNLYFVYDYVQKQDSLKRTVELSQQSREELNVSTSFQLVSFSSITHQGLVFLVLLLM